jgi:hypothetical protein
VKKRVFLCLWLSALLAATPAWTQEEQPQPRVIWGVIIQFAISKLTSHAWDVFSTWLDTRVPGVAAMMGRPFAEPPADSGAELKARSSGAIATRGAAPVVGDPDAPLQVRSGEANYQGVHVALIARAPDGRGYVFRPVSAGFKTGERFKLRVVSTFAGELTIENINPRGERRQVYPGKADYVVSLQAGRETVIPLGRDEFFELAGATGREQLVVNLADPRALGDAGSRHAVFRQDQKYGSNFLQQVSAGTYPRISQSIELVHAGH